MYLRRTGILTAVVVLAAAWSPSGIALASPSAPNQSGAKFSDAKKSLEGAGFAVVVASRVGDRTSLDDCLVVHQHLRGEAQTTKKKTVPKTVLVSVTCYAGTASATKPGSSSASTKSKH